MADSDIGTVHGFPAVGDRQLLADITADGVNTVTVAATDLPKLHAGMVIDILNKSTFASVATDRTITNVTSAGVVTYDGADVAASTTDDGIFLANSDSPTARSNFNGGPEVNDPYVDPNMLSVAQMRARLTAIDSTFYTSARLNTMTKNDMIFALRTEDTPLSIKQ